MTAHVDLIIRNAFLIDGTGSPGYVGEIAIKDDLIVGLGNLEDISANAQIDTGGKAVSPGFIDVHTHDDRALLVDPLMSCKVSQGVTSVIVGNCGTSLAPLKISHRPPAPLDLVSKDAEGFFDEFSEYIDALDKSPPALNALCLVGHSSLRAEIMDNLDRPATNQEIKHMRGRLERALEEGAIGMSTGLFYPTAVAAPTSEIIELAKALKSCGAIHTTHMRDEADNITDSLNETFKIGREAEIPVVVSHHKCAGVNNHGRTVETLPMFDKAIAQQRIGLDVYPYVASSTMLDLRRMSNASRVIVTWSHTHPECSGRDLDDIAKEWELSLVDAADKLNPAGAIYFMMDEEDVQRVLKYPHSMIGSDGLPHDEHPHPRLWGTFPRVLGHYVREIGLFSIEEAVRKMTSLPAAQFGMKGRGLLEVGAVADLVLFDPKTVIDLATWDQPMTPARGIEHVWVNGQSVWCGGEVTGNRPGKALRLQDLESMGRAQ
ncbi:MAG: D-aminoacylase [Planctomycetota bacterium]|nr:MAG: D-aminoacylase [Planctomycetota bacterium]